MLNTLLAIMATMLAIFYIYMKWTFQYWKRKGVPSLPAAFPFGHLTPIVLQQQHFGELFKYHYDSIKAEDGRFCGFYLVATKGLIISDIELIKCVLQKDFHHFANHGGYVDEENDPLGAHLFALEDEQWKVLREKLTPTFTSGKMKMMFPIMVECGDGLVDVLNEYAYKNSPVNIKEPLGRYSTDIIMSAAFGIQANCLKDPDSLFRKYGRLANNNDAVRMFKNIVHGIFPRTFLKKIKFKLTRSDVEEFFMDVVKRTVDYREKNNVIRKDFMHLLIQLKNMGKLNDNDILTTDKFSENGFTINQVAAQAFIFFLGGFETSSTLMTFTLYELGLYLDIQKKLRDEINNVLKIHNGQFTYDAIMEMKYLDKVVQEGLRKYPPLPLLMRLCNKDYKIPDSDVVIEKNTSIVIPTYGIHMDHEYYPNPAIFDPERFNEDNKSTRPSYTWLPFGEGPRICIGSRFGLLQTKIGIAKTIQNFEITINKKTAVPNQFDRSNALLNSNGGIWLNFKKLN